MDSLMALVNTAFCLALAAVATWACLSPRVRDGVVIKLGLVCLALGFGANAWAVHDGINGLDAIAMARAQLLINAGVALVVVGWLWRGRIGGSRRTSDFVDLDDGHWPPA